MLLLIISELGFWYNDYYNNYCLIINYLVKILYDDIYILLYKY